MELMIYEVINNYNKVLKIYLVGKLWVKIGINDWWQNWGYV